MAAIIHAVRKWIHRKPNTTKAAIILAFSLSIGVGEYLDGYGIKEAAIAGSWLCAGLFYGWKLGEWKP